MTGSRTDRDPTALGRFTGPVIGIVLVGANLRAALTGVGPLLPAIEQDTGLSSASAGLLVALPLLMFAAVSTMVVHTIRRGPALVVRIALAVLIVGVLIRSTPGVIFLFVGTAILAAALGFGNVLLPAMVRGVVPEGRVGVVTGGYVTAMSLAAAVSSGIAAPMAEHLPGGWRTALAGWAVLAIAALLVWSATERRMVMAPVATDRAPTPWRSPLAWQVSVFMGLQSLGFYATLAWLPSVMHDHGISPSAAGIYLFFFQILGLVAINALPQLSRRLGGYRCLAVIASVLDALGFALLACAPQFALVSIALLGPGAGICLVLAMTFQTERAQDAPQAAALAGMAQTVGFTLAAVGPLVLGLLHSRTARWEPALITLAAVTIVQAAVGVGAGRDTHVGA
ncbi:CynX/NimT family MFS transporter [Nocardia nepalensis]|uniref:CynX/NimT family MFS transporter n=1 Tax=Nocardia nepalensis TaxID=3375448 RepID=UPI003B67B7E1